MSVVGAVSAICPCAVLLYGELCTLWQSCLKEVDVQEAVLPYQWAVKAVWVRQGGCSTQGDLEALVQQT